MAIHSTPLVSIALFALAPLAASTEMTLLPSDPTVEEFGTSIDTDGQRLVVGAVDEGSPGGPGSAFVFEWNGTAWVETAQLSASDGFSGDVFGGAVGVDGDTICVGASGTGFAYVFEYVGGTWSETAKLAGFLDSDAATVSMSNDTIVLGVNGASFGGGGITVKVYEKVGSSWDLVFSPTGRAGAISGDRLIVGHPSHMFSVGQVTVYTRGNPWAVEEVFSVISPIGQEFLGSRVAIDGDTVVFYEGPGGAGYGEPINHIVERRATGWVSVGGDGAYEISGDLMADRSSASRRHSTSDQFGAWRRAPSQTFPSGSLDSSAAIGGNWHFVGAPNQGVQGLVTAVRVDEYAEFYCTGKVSSVGVEPQIEGTGFANTSINSFMRVSAAPVPANVNGLFFYGLTGPAAIPFLGGTLCVQPPLRRTTIVNSGSQGVGGLGSLMFNLGQWFADGNDPGLSHGQDIYGQFWFRDTPDPQGVGLTDAILTRFVQ